MAAMLLLLLLMVDPHSRSGAVAGRHSVPLLGAHDGAQRGLLQADAAADGATAAEAAAAAGYPDGGSVLVRTAAQLVAAVANPAVQVAVLAGSVSLTEADWAPVAQPVVEVRRNLTLLGAYTAPTAWPILNLGYTANLDGVGIVKNAKIRMGPGCAFTFRRLVLTDGRELPQFLFMGLDVFAESPAPNSTLASAWPVVHVHETALWQRSCLPLSVRGLPGRVGLPRPVFLPGVQNSSGTSVPRPPDCVDDASAPPMARCWPARGTYRDMALYAYDADAYDRQTPAGYAMHLTNATFWCDILMTDDCVAANGGYLACYYSLYPYSRKANLTAKNATSIGTGTDYMVGTQATAAAAGGDGGSGSSSVLAPVLCGVLAGVAGLVLGAGLVAAFVIYRRRRTHAQRKKESSSDPTAHARQLLLAETELGDASCRAPAPAAVEVTVGGNGDGHQLPMSSLAPNNRCSNAGVSGKLAVRSTTDSEANSVLMSGMYGSHLFDTSARAGGASPGTRPNDGAAADTRGGHTVMQTARTIEPNEEDERALVPVTPLTPFQSHIPLDVKLGSGGGEVRLLPVTLGKGACGRVVQGVWCGRRVAVKLLHRGLFNAAAAVHGGGGLVFGGAFGDAPLPAVGPAVHPVPQATPSADGQAASAEANGGLLSIGVLSRVAKDKHPGLVTAVGTASTGFTLGENFMQSSPLADSTATQPPALAPAAADGASEPEAASPGPAEAALLALAAAAVPAALSPWWLGTGSFEDAKEAGAAPEQAALKQPDERSVGNGDVPAANPEAHASTAAEQAAAPAAAAPAQAELGGREQPLPPMDRAAAAAAAMPQSAAQPLRLASIRMGGSSALDPPNSCGGAPNEVGQPAHQPQPRPEDTPASHTAPDSLMSISVLAEGDSVAAGFPAAGRQHKRSLPPSVAEAGEAPATSVSGTNGMGTCAASVAAVTAASGDTAALYEVPDVSTLDAASQAAAARLQAAAQRRKQPLTHGGAVRRTMAQEVEVLARLQHANIVQLLAANLNPACPCLVVELMDTSLDKLLYGVDAAAGPAATVDASARSAPLAPRSQAPLLPLPKVLHIALQVARALAYLHPTIIHRDLKPANVLISDPGSASPVVKIADFGLSRLQDTVLITAHVDVGTAPYMAPEALDARNCVITHHSDMYSYGIMLYEMLAGVRPWRGLNMLQVAVAVCEKQQRPRLEDLGEARCPPALWALVSQCWDPVPERRPGAAEVAKQLALMLQQQQQQL
ncbi:hypothetical protein HXX76_001082 [Chlamydomonas incerta]|uniref:Protein kinase domain-containing protein n=1 Tax=Chlamydomonas incerta TaxID=51695 RepID=A0A835WBF5_CHLIN|nr:hypothetical protein HXX76_001082 [Chlamydomonas incerta]|eukprot:KAG2444325.1 hypothetical protein HXX76_001082 [Chlamydomonas incerta]